MIDPIRMILNFLRSLLTRRYEPSETEREGKMTIIEGKA